MKILHKHIKEVISVVLVICCLFSLGVSAPIKEKLAPSIKVYNPFTLADAGTVSGLSISNSELSFWHNGKQYAFTLESRQMESDVEGVLAYFGQNEGIVCDVIQYGENYSIILCNPAVSPSLREKDPDTFTILYGPDASDICDEDLTKAEFNDQSVTPVPRASQTAHVLVSGIQIPLLISSGVCEAWGYYKMISPYEYEVSSIRYSVAKNLSTDGIALWYEELAPNIKCAWKTPMNCPPGEKTQKGPWFIDVTDNIKQATLVAQTYVTALVKGFPLGWEIYDTFYFKKSY